MSELVLKQLGLASNLARHLRAVNRVSATEIDGHTLTYADLADIWATEDENHIVLTQHKDPTWQHWTLVPDEGWRFIGVYTTDKDAEQAIADYDPGLRESTLAPGTYVMARMTDTSRLIRVKCESESGPQALLDIFTRLGYQADILEALAS